MCVCVCEHHHGRGVNIIFENGQYPHNSSYDTPCLPCGATREVDDGILAVESWLMSATKYIAIDNAPLRPGVHVDGRSRMARPDQSAGHAKLKSKQPLFCSIVAKNKHDAYIVLRVALGAVARVNQVIYYVLPEYINDCLEVIGCSMSLC